MVRKGKRHSKVFLKILAFLLFFMIICSFILWDYYQKWRNEEQLTEDVYKVKRVIDGDTLELTNGERVRLIGVDTPETKHPEKPVEYFGKEAYRFTQKMVEGKQVRLEYDWQRRDKYNRLLAYVYLLDGTFLNAEIIKQGYGFAYTKYPFKYLEEFRGYEREARENKRGLWK
jgi:micrococcal nuclease